MKIFEKVEIIGVRATSIGRVVLSIKYPKPEIAPPALPPKIEPIDDKKLMQEMMRELIVKAETEEEQIMQDIAKGFIKYIVPIFKKIDSLQPPSLQPPPIHARPIPYEIEISKKHYEELGKPKVYDHILLGLATKDADNGDKPKEKEA